MEKRLSNQSLNRQNQIKRNEAKLEKIVIKEDVVKKSMHPPFAQGLKSKKKAINQTEILEELRQVKVNISY